MLESLGLLLTDRKLGSASKLAFLQLWEYSGCQPGRIIITAAWLGGAFGRSPKSAWDWLEELAKHDLIALGERNERRGTVAVDVFNPCPGNRQEIADPQTRLPLSFHPEGQGNIDNRGAGEANPSRQAIPDAGVPGVSLPRPPDAASSVHAGVSAPKPPRSLEPKKQEIKSQYFNPKNQEPKYQRAKEPRSGDDGPQRAATAIAEVTEAALAASSPAILKEGLQRQIQLATGTAAWVAGAFANLIAYHGLPPEQLDKILADMDRGGAMRNPGAVFHSRARAIAALYHLPWPRGGSSRETPGEDAR